MRVTKDIHIMRKAGHRYKRVDMARWITGYILPFGVMTSWIEGQSIIKKSLLFVDVTFLLFIISINCSR